MTNAGDIPALSDAQKADMRTHALAAEATIARNLGPGETPKRLEDVVHGDGSRKHGEYVGSPGLEEAEKWGNPLMPYDASGHKVHPADGLSRPTRADVETALGFGGAGGNITANTAGANSASGPNAGNYTVSEHIDPASGELVRQKIGVNGEILDEQREAAPGQHGMRHASPQSRRYDANTNENGPVL